MKADARLSHLIKKIGTLSYTLSTDYFDFLINTIISQMLSNKASTAIYNRLNILCNNCITPENISNLSFNKLRIIGISGAKSKYILDLSNFILINPNFFKTINKNNDEMIINDLTKIKGIGVWSAKMYLIFVLNRIDILPYEDVAFLQAFKWLYSTKNVNKNYIFEKCISWKPYSTIAARYLYKALDEGYTNEK
jgi:DNA-3-methyladenine glycosylase II